MSDSDLSLEQLREDLRRMEAFMDNSPTAAFMKDAAGRYVYCNSRMESMFYSPLGGLEGRTDFEWLPEYLASQMWTLDQTVLTSGDAHENMQSIPAPEGGESHWLFFRFQFTSAAGEKFVGGIAADVTQLKEMQERLESLTLTDDLTGLNNRRGFLRLAEARLQLSRRTGERLLLIFADLDGLKVINDTHGHEMGNEAIRAAAQVMRETFRQTDVTSRWGGDEFVALLGASDVETESFALERLQERVGTYNKASELPYELSISVGACPVDLKSGQPLDEVIAAADAAMYADKARKKAAMR
ncbi:MAG TPA: GGDEF domain-containing protein [Pyrinomonadaceae bacterium]|nr:GGDEF domain-containing protein [Pyrinomonadaceae bacterium]